MQVYITETYKMSPASRAKVMVVAVVTVVMVVVVVVVVVVMMVRMLILPLLHRCIVMMVMVVAAMVMAMVVMLILFSLCSPQVHKVEPELLELLYKQHTHSERTDVGLIYTVPALPATLTKCAPTPPAMASFAAKPCLPSPKGCH